MTIDTTNVLQGYNLYKTNNLENLTRNKSLESLHDKALKEQTDAFEAILLKTLLDTSLHLDDPLYPKAAGSDIYQSMYKDTLAMELAGGFGYSQMLFDWLKQQQKG